MRKIYESVAMGIVAVNEIGDLINDERNYEKKEALECARYAYYYLIDNMNKQFGVEFENVMEALINNGYESTQAEEIIVRYEKWACHVVKQGDYKEENL